MLQREIQNGKNPSWYNKQHMFTYPLLIWILSYQLHWLRLIRKNLDIIILYFGLNYSIQQKDKPRTYWNSSVTAHPRLQPRKTETKAKMGITSSVAFLDCVDLTFRIDSAKTAHSFFRWTQKIQMCPKISRGISPHKSGSVQ